MRLLIQRVRQASVSVENQTIASIQKGLLIFVGITQNDQPENAQWLAEKVAYLRIFEDQNGKMNLNVSEVGGEILSVSQFTLYADLDKGRRPGYDQAAKPDHAELVYRFFNQSLKQLNLKVQEGKFQAQMLVQLENEGPATFFLER